MGALPFLALLPTYAGLQRPRHRAALAALVLFVVTAAPTFLVAWSKTGSPVFPFFNKVFHSSLLPQSAEIGDTRFRQPLTWHTPYDVTFRSRLFYEGQSGAFGFQYLVFAPLGIAAVLLVRKRMIASASLIGIGAALLILRSEPNARYVYPELPLLMIPVASLLSWAAARQRLLWQLLVGFAIVSAGVNIWFMPGSSYWHKDLYGPFTDSQRASYTSAAAPLRVAIDWFNRVHPGAPVLLTNDTAVAGIAGPVYENQWHQPHTQNRIRDARDLPALRALMDEWQVRYVIARQSTLTQVIRPRTLRDLVEHCGAPEFHAGEFYVARLLPGCLVKAEPEAPLQPTTLASRGHYDDFNPAILYRGEWERSTDFEEPAAHTTSYSAEPDAAIAFAFEGTGLTWTFAKAPNRGIAEVTIDGASQGTVDQYAPSAQWRSRVDFAIPSGRHLLVIRVLGRHRDRSEDSYIDLDAFDVR
jgi:hypothetical protein